MNIAVDTHQVNEDIELEQTIASETVDLLFSAIPGSVSATIVISTFLSAVLWKLLEDITLVYWVTTVVAVNLARFVLYKYYMNRDKEVNNTAFWDIKI